MLIAAFSAEGVWLALAPAFPIAWRVTKAERISRARLSDSKSETVLGEGGSD